MEKRFHRPSSAPTLRGHLSLPWLVLSLAALPVLEVNAQEQQEKQEKSESQPTEAARPPSPSAKTTGSDQPDAKPGLTRSDESTKPPAAQLRPLAYRLKRPYRYEWFLERRKIGDIVVEFREEQDALGKVLRLVSRRHTRHAGRQHDSKASLWLDSRRRPLRYEEDVRVGQLDRKAFQNTSIRFQGGTAKLEILNNGQKDRKLEHRIRVTPRTHLFATGALEHWTIFVADLGDKLHKVEILYPEFASVLEIEFRPSGRETLTIGKKRIAARRYDFRYLKYGDTGQVWVDAEGRLLQYRSGPSRLTLEGV